MVVYHSTRVNYSNKWKSTSTEEWVLVVPFYFLCGYAITSQRPRLLKFRNRMWTWRLDLVTAKKYGCMGYESNTRGMGKRGVSHLCWIIDCFLDQLEGQCFSTLHDIFLNFDIPVGVNSRATSSSLYYPKHRHRTWDGFPYRDHESSILVGRSVPKEEKTTLL